jgi:ParB family transcriptional regulator, chromosome partitioning protein
MVFFIAFCKKNPRNNMQTLYKKLRIEQLQRGQYQPRQLFDEDALQELAQSIRTQGLIEPLIVREISSDVYEIIAGERRWRAAMIAGLYEVPCLISDYTDAQAAAVTVIENIQRQDLNLVEEAASYQRLHQEFQFSQDEIATLVGKSRSHIANILRLLTLCESVQGRLKLKQLSLGHARMLVGLNVSQQEMLAKKACEENWSVRRLEEEVRLIKLPTESTALAPSPDILQLQTQLAEQMGTPVQIIKDNDQGGWLKIKFFDNDTLAGLLERMGMRNDE